MTICENCTTPNHQTAAVCAGCGASLQGGPATGDPFVGRMLGGRFKLEVVVGSGDIGMVYLGVDQRSRHKVAVKIVHPDVAASHGSELLKATREVASLRHAKIARVFGASRDSDGTTYIVSEFLEGTTLKSVMSAEGAVGPRRAADILFQLCSAVAPIHRSGRAHANLKPENVFLTRRSDGADQVKIVDPGSPTLFGVRAASDGSRVIIGSAKYFSPEQAQGQRATLQSDQFTIGIIGYQLLTGSLPFHGATPDQLLSAICGSTPPPVGQRASVPVPPQLVAIIDRCLSKAPEGRYPDLRALATELATVIKSTQAIAAPATPRKRFGAGANISTVIANPNLLNDLMGTTGDDFEDDDDRTVMRSLSQAEILGQTQPPVAPPSQNDMANIPEPLMFTGALASDDLAAALAAATQSVGGPVIQQVKIPTAKAPQAQPRGPSGPSGLGISGDLADALQMASGAPVSPRRTPPPQAPPPPSPLPAAGPGGGMGDDLAAALAAAAGERPGEAAGFNPFDTPTPDPNPAPAGQGFNPFDAPAPAPAGQGFNPFDTPVDAPAAADQGFNPFDGPQAAPGSMQPSALADTISANVMPSEPVGASSPLATAADFKALSPIATNRVSVDVVPTTTKTHSGRSRTPLILGLLLLLAAGGAGAWYFTQDPEPAPIRRRAATKKQPKKPAKAAKPIFSPFKYRIVTLPLQAQVYEGEKLLGATPLDIRIKTDAPCTYVIKAKGFEDRVHHIEPAKMSPNEGKVVAKFALDPVVVAPPPAPTKVDPTKVEKTPAAAPDAGAKKKVRIRRRRPPKQKKLKDPFAD